MTPVRVIFLPCALQERHLSEQKAEMEAKARKALELAAAIKAKEVGTRAAGWGGGGQGRGLKRLQPSAP